MNEIFVITGDLIFSTRITHAAAAQGLSCSVLRDLAQLQDALAHAPPRLALIDLESDAETGLAAIAALKEAAPAARVVAYYSHVRADHAAAARSAGADDALARSAFVARLPEILAKPE